MTTAEMFAAFQAFMDAQNAATDTVAAVAADVVKTSTVKTDAPLTIVRGTISVAGGYGVKLEETGDELYSVGRGYRETIGKIFQDIPKGTIVEISLKGKRAKSVQVVTDAAPKVTAPKVTAPKVTAPKVTAPKVTAPKVTAPILTPEQAEIAALKAKLAALEAPTVAPTVAAPLYPKVKAGTCPFCGNTPNQPTSAPHGNEAGTWFRCLARQFGNETGTSITPETGVGAKLAAFGAWIDATDRVYWSPNAQGWLILAGVPTGTPTTVQTVAPKQDAPKQDAPKQDAPKQDAPKQDAPKGRETRWHDCAAQEGKKRLANAQGTCKRCEGMAPQAPVAAPETVETTGSVSVDVAADEGTVPARLEPPTEGTFKCYVDKFKTGPQKNPEQPIVRLYNGAELVNEVGVGFTVRCATADILRKLEKFPMATWFTVTFKDGLVTKVTRVLNEKTGLKAPVLDTAGIKTSGKNEAPVPATPRKDDTPAERRAAMRQGKAKGTATGTVNATSEHCPKCQRRFSMVGRNASSLVCKACDAA